MNKEALELLDGRDLRLIVELGRCGSVSVAAEQCGIGQPAATKRLQRMAAALEAELITNTGNKFALTAEGKALSDHGQRVQQSTAYMLRRLVAD